MLFECMHHLLVVVLGGDHKWLWSWVLQMDEWCLCLVHALYLHLVLSQALQIHASSCHGCTWWWLQVVVNTSTRNGWITLVSYVCLVSLLEINEWYLWLIHDSYLHLMLSNAFQMHTPTLYGSTWWWSQVFMITSAKNGWMFLISYTCLVSLLGAISCSLNVCILVLRLYLIEIISGCNHKWYKWMNGICILCMTFIFTWFYPMLYKCRHLPLVIALGGDHKWL